MKKLTQRLTYERLHEILNYDSETGIFTNKIDRSNSKKGSVVGCKMMNGYLVIRIDDVNYLAHRLAWMYINGYFPENMIDHINRNKIDNKLENLREVSNQCNIRNSGNCKHNTSGVKGVFWEKLLNKWRAQITINLKRRNIGVYKNFSEAVCARLAVEQCIGWSGCDNSSPAYKYVQKMLKGGVKNE